MNAYYQLHRLPIYRFRLLFLSAFVVAVSGFAPGTDAQQLPTPPFAFPPSFQAPLPAQTPNLAVRRTQAKSIVKAVLRRKPPAKMQLNQALIAETFRRNAAHVAGLLA